MTDTPTIDGPRREAASGNADALVILLHGYGADGNDLIGLAPPLSQVLPKAEFVSPNGPEPCRASPMGRQWFPISYLDGSSEKEMNDGFVRASETLHAFVDAEIARSGLASDRVALLGFSQGTMMSLEVGLRRSERLAGIVGFSGRLLRAETLTGEIASRPPVLLVHGADDPMVPPASLEDAEKALSAAGVEVGAHMRPGLGHGIDPGGLQLAAEFLVRHLG